MSHLRSIVEVEIKAPREKVAELYADPRNSPKWMHDLARYEPVGGEQGMPGSTYRLVPKEGDRVFLVTVVKRDLPDELTLHMASPDVDIVLTARLMALSPTRTKLVNEQVFTFKGASSSMIPDTVKDAIKASHRSHMEDFKRFAESHEPEGG